MEYLVRMGVFITDGNQRSSLAVIRSLGHRGIDVTVGAEEKGSLAGVSRYCRSQFVYSAPEKDPSTFQQQLTEHCQNQHYNLLIPMTDLTCQLVADVHTELEEHVTVALPPGNAFEIASDKGRLVKLAQSLSVPVPRTIFVENIEQIEEIATRLTYPVVIKPVRSRVRTTGGWHFGGVRYAESSKVVVATYRRMHEQIPLPLIQEMVNGPGLGLFALCEYGNIRTAFAHRRIREKPPSGGVSVLREAIPVDPAMRRYAEKLLSTLNWHGVAMVEFKLDNADMTPKLMEINGRFWGSLQLAIDAGVDFPWLLYRMYQGKPLENSVDYRSGVKTRWFLGDMDHLLIVWSHRRKSLALPPKHPGRLKTAWLFLTSFRPGVKSEVFRLSDPVPAWIELKQYLQAIWRSVKGRLR